MERAGSDAVRIEHGVVRVWLVLRPKTADLLDAIPGSHAREAKLKNWRTRYRDLKELVHEIALLTSLLSGRRIMAARRQTRSAQANTASGSRSCASRPTGTSKIWRSPSFSW